MDKREQTLYEILGISQNAILKEIKIAYRKKTMEYHPDMNPSKNNDVCHKMMYKINEAYNTLRNPDLRAFYDEILFEEGKYDASNEEFTPPLQETSGNEPKTYKRTYKPNSAQYKYYNIIDFDEYMQEEFIEWLENFTYEYIRLAFNYYRNLNNDSDLVLEKIYNSFNNIIDYEKKLSIKEENYINKKL